MQLDLSQQEHGLVLAGLALLENHFNDSLTGQTSKQRIWKVATNIGEFDDFPCFVIG